MTKVATTAFPTALSTTDTLPLSRMQRIVLETLRNFEDGAKIVDLAQKLNMHVNTVRGHLDELSDMNAVVTELARSNGRGRPSVIFHARIPSSSQVLSEYAVLIHTLLEEFGDPDEPAAQRKAEEVGKRWAARLHRSGRSWSRPTDAVTVLIRSLRQLGFDPGAYATCGTQTNIDIHACPFHVGSHEPPSELMCAVHRGFLKEALGQYTKGIAEIELFPTTESNTCQVILQVFKDDELE